MRVAPLLQKMLKPTKQTAIASIDCVWINLFDNDVLMSSEVIVLDYRSNKSYKHLDLN